MIIYKNEQAIFEVKRCNEVLNIPVSTMFDSDITNH